MKQSNSIGISSQNLVEQIKLGRKAVYWLGAKPDYAYALNNFVPNATIISYLLKNSNINDPNQSVLTIETFLDYRSYDNGLHPLVDPDGRRLVMSRDEIIEYNLTSLSFEIVGFKANPEIVVINYPNRQSETTLIANAQALQQVFPY